MEARTKTIFTVLLIGLVAGVATLQTGDNKNLFKGQIFDQEGGVIEIEDPASSTELADLKPTLRLTAPESSDGDLIANVTVQNSGKGRIDGKQPFKYTISINGEEVLSNTDSYTTMEPGDSFSFSYPIPRSIYQYPSTGSVKLTLDADNNIEESLEDNNEVVVSY